MAVSRETPEGSRSSRGETVLDPELTQDYISQVSEEVEGRVTKKLSKEFSKTESRILGALSKLDEFLLNPQIRTCSVAVQGTSRNANSENREIHGDRSLDDPYPEVGYFPHHSGQLNSPETETISHMVTEDYPHKTPFYYVKWKSQKQTFSFYSSSGNAAFPKELLNLKTGEKAVLVVTQISNKRFCIFSKKNSRNFCF